MERERDAKRYGKMDDEKCKNREVERGDRLNMRKTNITISATCGSQALVPTAAEAIGKPAHR